MKVSIGLQVALVWWCLLPWCLTTPLLVTQAEEDHWLRHRGWRKRPGQICCKWIGKTWQWSQKTSAEVPPLNIKDPSSCVTGEHLFETAALKPACFWLSFQLSHPDKTDSLILINATAGKSSWTEWGYQKVCRMEIKQWTGKNLEKSDSSMAYTVLYLMRLQWMSAAWYLQYCLWCGHSEWWQHLNEVCFIPLAAQFMASAWREHIALSRTVPALALVWRRKFSQLPRQMQLLTHKTTRGDRSVGKTRGCSEC